MRPSEWARPTQVEPPDVVGIVEIATRLGVRRSTVDRWRQREVMPEPTWVLGCGPVWLWSTIRVWAVDTGRLTPGN